MATINASNNVEIPDTLIAAKGDLVVGSADDSPAVLTAGADDTMLMADDGEATGLKWTKTGPTHTSANGATAQIANVVFGTGSPPDAASVPEGTVWIKYTA
jgi:hypothetical protein